MTILITDSARVSVGVKVPSRSTTRGVETLEFTTFSSYIIGRLLTWDSKVYSIFNALFFCGQAIIRPVCAVSDF